MRPQRQLQAVKDQITSVPQRGIGYGILRYLSEDEDLVSGLKNLPHPEISFNYLGQLDKVIEKESLFAPAPESAGRGRSSSGMRAHLLEIDASIRSGRLYVVWSYSQNVYRLETIKWLAESFVNRVREFVTSSRSNASNEVGAADFPIAAVSPDDLQDILAALKGKLKR
jgi:non-ribosomal peptide synthase protein (TIGR01720 family)